MLIQCLDLYRLQWLDNHTLSQLDIQYLLEHLRLSLLWQLKPGLHSLLKQLPDLLGLRH